MREGVVVKFWGCEVVKFLRVVVRLCCGCWGLCVQVRGVRRVGGVKAERFLWRFCTLPLSRSTEPHPPYPLPTHPYPPAPIYPQLLPGLLVAKRDGDPAEIRAQI